MYALVEHHNEKDSVKHMDAIITLKVKYINCLNHSKSQGLGSKLFMIFI